jgi:hypothetical protein
MAHERLVGGTDRNIQENVMFVKSLIAVAAVASVVSFASTAAKADTTVSLGFGFGGFDPGYGFAGDYPGDYPVYRPRHRHHYEDYAPVLDYGISCDEGRNAVREAGFRNVRAYDCSAPTYGYQAMRHGDFFRVKVNYSGDIISVRPIY